MIARTDLWKMAKYKLFIDSEKKARHLKLEERNKLKEYFYPKNLAEKRDNARSNEIRLARAESNITMFNNYDENFYKDIITLCKGIENNCSSQEINDQINGLL